MSVRNWKAGVLIRVDSRHKGQAIHLMVLPEKKLIIYDIKQEICITYRKAENGKIAILCVVKPVPEKRNFFSCSQNSFTSFLFSLLYKITE